MRGKSRFHQIIIVVWSVLLAFVLLFLFGGFMMVSMLSNLMGGKIGIELDFAFFILVIILALLLTRFLPPPKGIVMKIVLLCVPFVLFAFFWLYW